jgi:hypothetical protein
LYTQEGRFGVPDGGNLNPDQCPVRRMYKGEKRVYETEDFNRVVAGNGSVTGHCEAEDCVIAHATAVVPRPRS